MKRWSDVKGNIRSINESEKSEIEIVAQLVGDIIDYRKKLGLTQRQLASMTGIKQSAIARLESGGTIPRLDTVLRIATALGMKVALVPNKDRTI